jgi:hypothetical protein
MNEKSVTSYELILENCETIILSATDLIEANFAGLDKHIDIWQSENQVLRKESLVAKDALLIFDAENLKARRTSFSNGEYNAYERVTKHSDIVALEIFYSDSSNELIYVPFDGDYENKLQETTLEEVQGKERLEIYFGKNVQEISATV